MLAEQTAQKQDTSVVPTGAHLGWNAVLVFVTAFFRGHGPGCERAYQVEAEDGEGEGAKEREDAVQGEERLVQEGSDRRVDEHVEDDLQQRLSCCRENSGLAPKKLQALHYAGSRSRAHSTDWPRALEHCQDRFHSILFYWNHRKKKIMLISPFPTVDDHNSRRGSRQLTLVARIITSCMESASGCSAS